MSVVNCALHSGEELEEGDREVEERGWVTKGPGPGVSVHSATLL